MTQRHPRRTDAEWIDLIQECRSSGLSDKCWCEENHIQSRLLTRQEFRWLMEGLSIEQPKAIKAGSKKKDV